MMTAVSFIIGIMPMMLATGAGAQSRRIIGTTVFSGMLGGDDGWHPVYPVAVCTVSTYARVGASAGLSAALPVGNGDTPGCNDYRAVPSPFGREGREGGCVHVAFGREPRLICRPPVR